MGMKARSAPLRHRHNRATAVFIASWTAPLTLPAGFRENPFELPPLAPRLYSSWRKVGSFEADLVISRV